MTSHTVTVRSSAHTYQVLVGSGVLNDLGALLRELFPGERTRSVALVTDANVAKLYADAAEESIRGHRFDLTRIIVPAGESSKSLTEVARIANAMIAAGLDRGSVIVALGGGVIGDLAGFVAAIYFRGIPYVQVPTTIVGQVDSSVGGKTGINTPSGKNLLGAFHPPAAVLADVDTLRTLPDREFNEGFAEVIKHGVIRDRDLLAHVEKFSRAAASAEELAAIVVRNLEIKAAIVAADEFERSGERALLNFGHTVGHGIEQAAGYGRFLHGEAVALGMLAAGRLSMVHAALSLDDFAQLEALLRRFDLPLVLPPDIGTDAIMAALGRDKKFEAGTIRFVLTPRFGEALLCAPGQITSGDIQGAIDSLRRGA